MKNKKLNWKLLLRLSVTIILISILWLQIKNTNSLSIIKEKFDNFNIFYLVLAASIFFISLLFSTFQWKLLLNIQNIFIPYRKLFSFYTIGLFFNNFLPSNWGGDIVRVYDTSIYTKEWEKVTTSIVIDRILGLFALIFIGFIALLIFYSKNISIKITIMSIILLIIPIFLFIFFDFSKITSKIKKKNKITNFIKNIIMSLSIYQKEKKMSIVFLVALITQTFRIAMNILVAYSINFFFPIHSFFVIVPVIGIASALPLSINGVGLREYSGTLITNSLLNINDKSIVIIFSLGYLVIVAVSLIGGILFIVEKIKKK